MNGKYLLVANLLAMMVLLLTLVPVSTQQEASYNPWVDTNEDGIIDIFDLISMAGIYGASGNPAKNVTVAGLANKLAFNVSILLGINDAYATDWIPIDGYSKVTVCIDCNEPSPVGNYYTLMTARYVGGVAFTVDQKSNFGYSLVKTYDVPNQRIYVEVGNGPNYPATVTIDVYLIP